MEEKIKQTVYLESSVVSYYANRRSSEPLRAARQQITKSWWDTNLHQYEPVISQIVVEEISGGNPEAAKRRRAAVAKFRYLEISPAIKPLAEAFFSGINLPEKARNDAFHLALCALHHVDYIVSWNLTHISGIHSRQKAFAICTELGYNPPIICTPTELMEE